MTQVKLYANLRKLAGTKELSITGATIGAVLTELFKLNSPLGDVILENGKIRPHFVVMLNGHNMIDLNMQVTEQDVIAIFPPIAGG
jgi:MoaD family protein